MSNKDEFWQYAKEAMRSALAAESDDDRQSLFELARTWTLAALLERHSLSRSVAMPRARLGLLAF
jgi:hypothetical protein